MPDFNSLWVITGSAQRQIPASLSKMGGGFVIGSARSRAQLAQGWVQLSRGKVTVFRRWPEMTSSKSGEPTGNLLVCKDLVVVSPGPAVRPESNPEGR